MKVQLWSSGLETASRWGNKDTFEPLERHDFNSLEAGRVEESPGQDPRPLICARTFTNRSSLSFVIREWKTCLIGSKVKDSLRKFGDLMEILEMGFGPLYLCLVKQHLTSVIIWLSYFYQEPHHHQVLTSALQVQVSTPFGHLLNQTQHKCLESALHLYFFNLSWIHFKKEKKADHSWTQTVHQVGKTWLQFLNSQMQYLNTLNYI